MTEQEHIGSVAMGDSEIAGIKIKLDPTLEPNEIVARNAEYLETAISLIREAKSEQSPVDHLDAAENWLDKIILSENNRLADQIITAKFSLAEANERIATLTAVLSSRPAQKPVAWRISGKNMNGSPFLVFTDSVNVGGQVIKREPLYLAPQPLHTTNCCKCGRIIDTREKKDGGDDFGAQLSDGRWTCSIECDDAVVDPEPVAWCQPNYEGKIHPRKFMVVYEDSEMGNAVFDNENEAREHFDRASVAWNCYLFGLMPRSAAPQPVINPTHSQVAGTPCLLTDPAPSDNLLGDNQPRYTTKRLHDEIAKARAYGLEMAAQLIVANTIQDTSRGKVLVPRQEGNQDGLHYAAEIRHLAAAVGAKERKE